MNKMVSIRTKLISGTMILILTMFTCFLLVVTVLNIMTVEKNVANSKKSIWNSLIVEGKILVRNNSIALTGMAEDNAFTAVKALVSSTVSNGNDIIYGIYMNTESVPWVYVTNDNCDGNVTSSKPLTDSISVWAVSLDSVSYRSFYIGKQECVEFAAPVSAGGEKLGCIRYGVSTRKINLMIDEVLSQGNSTRRTFLVVFLCIGAITLFIGYILVRRIAGKITGPIALLVNSTRAIAEGNYNQSIVSDSNDEIGDLARQFEAMRVTIKQYTDHLQVLINEKMRQVNDILDNIDQGLFTVNLDGSINRECSSRANEILQVKNVGECTIDQVLRLDENQKEKFLEWIRLVASRHTWQRWYKLTKLAPVQSMELINQGNGIRQYISITYQKICNPDGELSKIMVLALDETEKRNKEQQMAEERLRHENEVRSILGIFNTSLEEITEFSSDTQERISFLNKIVRVHLGGVVAQREHHPDGPEYHITEEQIETMYRHVHTIKGNAGSYGFTTLASLAHNVEDQLDNLRYPVKTRRGDSLAAAISLLIKMDQEVADIQQKIDLIFKKDSESFVRIPDQRIKKIQQLISQLSEAAVPDRFEPLVYECMTLTWKPLKLHMQKYYKIIQTVSQRQKKSIEFVVVNDDKLYPVDEFKSIDEILVHLIRNAVDHGIENGEIRKKLNKGTGTITLNYLKTENGNRTIVVSDDGCGVDIGKLAEISVQKGIVTPEDLSLMTETQKIMLMFHAGLSTASSVSEISGRGVGMNIVKQRLDALGGTIHVETHSGRGTVFTIELPVQKIDYN